MFVLTLTDGLGCVWFISCLVLGLVFGDRDQLHRLGQTQ
jgi:hypothetical protein